MAGRTEKQETSSSPFSQTSRRVQELKQELDAYSVSRRVARFWWRDDDAVADTSELRRLLHLAKLFRIVPAVAVVPARATDSLVDVLSSSECCVWQHGWTHDFHAAGEFGEGRPVADMAREALMGQQTLDRLFGVKGWQRVFVPPNHCISMLFKGLLPSLGYFGISAGLELTPSLAHVRELNAEVDVMNWPAGKMLSADALSEMLIDQLRSRLDGNPIGILTHHLAFDEEAWALISDLTGFLCSHPAVEMLRADTLFAANGEFPGRTWSEPSSSETAEVNSAADITMVLTSCGRPDLLARTLDSFLKYNTYPIRDFIVMEDGVAPACLSGDGAYRGQKIRWLCTGKPVGQISAIDLAYQAVQTEYIFHCEDDWEFTAEGFIEKSLAILKATPKILQVWLRALDDTNGHPVIDVPLTAGGVPYRLMQPAYMTADWGTWHGFSLNPGLRRRRDYRLAGSFRAFDPSQAMNPYDVERDVGEFYMKRGFIAAILADRDSQGYVRHIGWGRRVEHNQ